MLADLCQAPALLWAVRVGVDSLRAPRAWDSQARARRKSDGRALWCGVREFGGRHEYACVPLHQLGGEVTYPRAVRVFQLPAPASGWHRFRVLENLSGGQGDQSAGNKAWGCQWVLVPPPPSSGCSGAPGGCLGLGVSSATAAPRKRKWRARALPRHAGWWPGLAVNLPS